MSDEDGELAPVVVLFPDADAEDESRPLATDRKEHGCYHRSKGVRLDVDARRVYCRGCDQEVPAFDELLHLARD